MNNHYSNNIMFKINHVPDLEKYLPYLFNKFRADLKNQIINDSKGHFIIRMEYIEMEAENEPSKD